MKIILLAMILGFNAWAVPETELPQLLHSHILPLYNQMQVGEFHNDQGMKIRYRTLLTEPGNRNLVIVPGRTEPTQKYAELIYDLRSESFNIFILDHQGQGESERLLKDSHKGHVLKFSDYDRDFKQWMNEVVLPTTQGKNLFLLAHSMGGAISTRYVAANPGKFQKIALSAPMFQIFTEPYPGPVARAFAQFLVLSGKGQGYAPDRGPYLPEEDTLDQTILTQSAARLWMNKYFFVEQPELALGGPTARWVNETLKATSRIQYLGSQINTPILILQAGLDKVVKPARQTKFCSMATNCQLLNFPDSEHEILQEVDGIRNQAIVSIKQFF